MLLNYDDVTYDTENGYQFDDLVDEVLDSLDNDDLVCLWNDYCEKNYYMDYHIFSMSELEEYLELKGTTAYDVITGNVVDTHCFSHCEAWFIDSIYGLLSSDSPWDLVDLKDDGFRDYFGEILLNDPDKYDCEEVDEEEEDGEE